MSEHLPGSNVEQPLTAKPAELKTERLPTREEIRSMFARFAEGKDLKEQRLREDEHGLYLLEVEMKGKAPGETIQLAYVRKGSFKECKASVTNIEETSFDEDGMPTGGKVLADLIDGEWISK